MADKFIIHGATFNGDGTSSAEASSNGGVGAWNNINVFEGSAPAYGSLAAGDTVYIRSKDAGGANVTRTLAANTTLGSANGTLANPIRWVLDNGATWAGVSGVLTYRRTAAWTLFTRSHNIIEALAEDALVFADEHPTSSLTVMWRQQAGSFVRNAWLDSSRVTFTSNGPQSYLGDADQTSGGCTAYNCRFTAPNKWYTAFINNGSYGLVKLVNPRIEVPAVFSGFPLLNSANLGSRLELYGGSVSGDGATTGLSLATFGGTAGSIDLYGTAVPQTVAELLTEFSGAAVDHGINAIAIDSTLGAIRTRRGGRIDSRQDGFYPTLSAQHNDSAGTPWSWKVYPNNAGPAFPLELPFIHTYTEAAAVKTVALELLVGTTFAAAHKGSIWLDLCYVDNATGQRRFVSSCLMTATAALNSSSASWSATTYGAVSFDKRRIELVTPTAVKQNSPLIATLRIVAKAGNANQILFVDGDISVT